MLLEMNYTLQYELAERIKINNPTKNNQREYIY